jgi:hypothetical protein
MGEEYSRKEDILFGRDIKNFLESIGELCRKHGGKAVRELKVFPDGETEEYLECTFPEGAPSFVEIDVIGYTTPKKEWVLNMCFGKSTECSGVRNLRSVFVKADLDVSQLRGIVNFAGYEGTESYLRFLFSKEDRLKGFRIRTYEREIIVNLLQ